MSSTGYQCMSSWNTYKSELYVCIYIQLELVTLPKRTTLICLTLPDSKTRLVTKFYSIAVKGPLYWTRARQLVEVVGFRFTTPAEEGIVKQLFQPLSSHLRLLYWLGHHKSTFGFSSSAGRSTDCGQKAAQALLVHNGSLWELFHWTRRKEPIMCTVT